MNAAARVEEALLLGEWACLGLLAQQPSHGFALAARLRPTGDIGRVWSLSRPLVYRSIDQLAARGLVRAVGEERGIAGGNRTIYSVTRSGRAKLRRWLGQPVEHLRDLRSELLLKLVIAHECGIDTAPLIAAQRMRVQELSRALTPPPGPVDVVALWRHEASNAALRFLDQLRAAE
jgi:PadR family transcriptional regulator AphA